MQPELMQQVLEYVEWLVSTNLSYLGTTKFSERHTTTFGFGLIEEFQEWEIEYYKRSDKSLLELGDMLAYYVLLSSSLKFSTETIVFSLSTFSSMLAPTSGLLGLAGSLKRLFRGDGDPAKVERFAFTLVCYALHKEGTTDLASVLQANRQKLEARLASTSTFEGQGDR